jgi:hypothetical protein
MAATVINISILPIGFHLLPYFFSYFSRANLAWYCALAIAICLSKYASSMGLMGWMVYKRLPLCVRPSFVLTLVGSV